MPRKTINLVCSFCSTEFSKELKEYNRQIKKNSERKWYCSRSCFGKDNVKSLGKYLVTGNVDNLIIKRKDDLSPFRPFLRRAKARSVKKSEEFNLNLQYLKKVWEDQRGVCSLTGKTMSLKESKAWNPWKPSLDRIDSSLGYVVGNIRYICCMGNLAKNRWTDDELVEFCRLVSSNKDLIK